MRFLRRNNKTEGDPVVTAADEKVADLERRKQRNAARLRRLQMQVEVMQRRPRAES